MNPTADEEELEFSSLQHAAGHALSKGRPAIVAAADVSEAVADHVGEAPFATTVEITTREIVSFHLSDDAVDECRGPTVESPGGRAGTPDPRFTEGAGAQDSRT
ncbi:MAG: hypothetical protein WBG57_10330, partial [Ornithinimicrobium sp.]